MTETELLHVLALQKVKHVGDVLAKRMIGICGSAEAVFKEKKNALLKIDGVGIRTLLDINDKRWAQLAEEELKFIRANNIQCLFFRESNYPERLKHCIDGPLILFQKGNVNIKEQPIISVVGTRNITTNGIDFCKYLIAELARYNPIIVSGFAYGADITAHLAAVEHNLQTIACLAHGFEQIYPRAHERHLVNIMRHGGLLTDFWSTDEFERTNFLRRNRIIAGLSEATVVIESAAKGGSLVTADIANSYDREVFAAPGRTTDSQSEGCNNLIKQHQAHILTKPEDIPFMLRWDEIDFQEKTELKLPELSELEKRIYDLLKKERKIELDNIVILSDLPVARVNLILLELELRKLVRSLPGKNYVRI